MKGVVPPRLNERQRQYLLAAYRTDQQVEGERRRDYLHGHNDRRPASQWRRLPYGRWEHWPGRSPTPLREQLAGLSDALISEGTGSTWRALAQRGMLEVEDQVPYLPAVMHYTLPHIRLTRGGCQQARLLVGEVPAKKPGKMLAQLWEQDPDAGRLARPAYCSSEAFRRLERSAPLRRVLGQANHERLVEGWPTAGLTTVGRIYYYQHYAANATAHPDVVAPDLGPPSAELVARWGQLDEQARALVSRLVCRVAAGPGNRVFGLSALPGALPAAGLGTQGPARYAPGRGATGRRYLGQQPARLVPAPLTCPG